MNSNSDLIKLVEKNRQLFWDIGQKNLQDLDNEAIVERFMSYGNMLDIHSLEKIMKRSDLHEIFNKLKSKKRPNLKPETVNFFNLYLQKSAS